MHPVPLIIMGCLACRPPVVIQLLPSDSGDTGGQVVAPPADTGVDQVPPAPDSDPTIVPGETGADPDPGDPFFDETTIPEIALELSEASMEALRVDPLTYAPGTFIFGDRVLENVGIRTKGSSSWQSIDDKPALKIKFDAFVEGQELYDLSDIVLNNMVGDYSMMHERVAYRFYREAGVPAGRAHHTHLTLNGEDYGLYTHVEAATKEMLIPWFDDTEGTMWEFWDSDFEPAYVAAFDIKFGVDDRAILLEASSALADSGPIDEATLATSLNLDAFLRYWAVSAIVAEYDGYPYRYPADDAYIYSDPTTGQIWFLPHGVDESFYYADYDFRTGVVSRLGWKCQATPGCEERMIEILYEALDCIEAMDPVAYFDEVRDQIRPYVKSDPKKPYRGEEITYYQDYMRIMVEDRRGQVDTILGL